MGELYAARYAVSLEIFLLQDSAVVLYVARDDEREGAHRERKSAGNSLSHPGGFGQVAIERDGADTHTGKFFDVRTPGDLVGLGAECGRFLIETWQGISESSREPERAEGEGALGVGYVAENLLHAPLARCVAGKRFFFRDAPEPRGVLIELVFDRAEGIISIDLLNVGGEVGVGFVGGWTTNHAVDFISRPAASGSLLTGSRNASQVRRAFRHSSQVRRMSLTLTKNFV